MPDSLATGKTADPEPSGGPPLRVAMLGSFPPLRGISSYCLELASALVRRLEVVFLSFKHIYPAFLYPGGGLAEDHSFPPEFPPGLTVHRRLTWYNPLSWIRAGLSTRADLLHAQWWSLPLAPIYGVVALGFKVRRKPVVFTVHNVSGHDGGGLFVAVSKILFRLGDHFIVHTEANRRRLIRQYGIAPRHISVIAHGSLDFQVDAAADRERLRQEMGIGPAHKVVLIFGAIRPYKGLDVAIRAFAEVVKKVPEAMLLVAGKPWEPWGGYHDLIQHLGLQDKVITRLDYVPAARVHRFFGAADLVVLPYRRFESQSGVGATAVAFRTPMIVSDVGGLPELVADRRAVVLPDDPEALAEAICRVLRDRDFLDQLRLSLDLVAETSRWDGIAKSTWILYKHVLTGGGCSGFSGTKKSHFL